MVHKIGVSGSVILSDSKLFHKLFKRYLPHIEIGNFKMRNPFKALLNCWAKQTKALVFIRLFPGTKQIRSSGRGQYESRGSLDPV